VNVFDHYNSESTCEITLFFCKSFNENVCKCCNWFTLWYFTL